MKGIVAGLVAVVVVFTAYWFWPRTGTLPTNTPTNTPNSTSASNSAQTIESSPSSAVKDSLKPRAEVSTNSSVENTPSIKEKPDFLQQEEWTQLQQAIADHPQAEVELERVVDYLRFQNQVEQWRNLEPHTDERQRLANDLLESLPERLANSEITGAEAVLLQEALLAELISDPDQLKQAQEEARQTLREQSPNNSDMQETLKRDKARQQELKRAEAELLSRYQNREISKAQLERALEEARIEIYQPSPSD